MTTSDTMTIPARADIPIEYTWNAESVFPSREAWAAELKTIQERLPELSQYQGRLKEGPVVFLEWMTVLEEFYRRVGHLFFYASMSQSVDANDQQATGMAGQAYGVFAQLSAMTAFSDPELLEIGQATIEQWVQQDNRLQPYAQYFHNLFRSQEHIRSAEVEEVLGLAGDPLSGIGNTFEVLTSADMKFPPATGSKGESIELGQGSIDKILDSDDREARRTGWENYADTYLSLKNTLAASYIASVKSDVFQMRVRRYASCLDASLFENNVPRAVFDNLLEVHRKNLPTWHKYWRVRRQALGVDKLHPYDIWAPISSAKPEVSYQQSVDWITEGLKPLGRDYTDVLRRGCLEQRWVDLLPNQGKRQGAFSFGWKGTYPFIMMNFTPTLGGMSTLAHELGHSMHSYLTWENQPFVYSNYSLFVAEVASNFNQAMTRAYLLDNNPDPQFQIAVIEEAMDNIHRYFFIMPTLARFELEVHTRVEQGDSPTADDLINLMADLFEEGYGGEMEIDRERVGITWATFGHLYAAYYVYQYATGISAAHALAHRMLSGTPGAAESYVNFLKSGSSLYPLDTLKVAGVDMTTPDPVEKAFAILAGYVDRLEALTA